MKRTLGLLLSLFLVACSDSKGGTTSGNPQGPEDTSSSGVVAEAVGGALSSSNSNSGAAGLKFTNAQTKVSRASTLASSTCPTYHNASGNNCTESGSSMWLDYNDCSFNNSNSLWVGVQALSKSSGNATCGTFPNPGSSGTLTMQYVGGVSSSSPGSVTVTSGQGSTAVIDDAGADLNNFDHQSLATIANSGYGTSVLFGGTGGARSSLTIGHQIRIVGGYDHSVYGTVAIQESTGATSRTLSGSLSVYHNYLQVVGTSTFNNVTHSDTCCLPISGNISTVFTQGAHTSPTNVGQLYLNHSETLTFTGCGTATLQAYDGSIQAVTLSRCF
jgi:hypothetical protein